MAVTLVRTEHLGGTAFNLFFEVENIGENNPVDGQIFDVHGLAQIKFFIRYTNDDMFTILLSVMKHEFTMGVKVEMKLTCEDPEFQFDFNCCETWTQLKKIHLPFELPSSTNFEFEVKVDINVASCKSVLDIMYMDDDFTDFQLSTPEGSVAVHRACLAAHSDVFKRMLCGEWKETATGRIKIQGVTLQTLRNLKQYMYLGTLPEEGLCPLLLIATEFLIDDLKLECTIKLAHCITSENLHDILEFSCVNNIPELTFSILKTVRAQQRDVIEAAEQRMLKPNPKSKNVIEEKHELVLKPNNE